MANESNSHDDIFAHLENLKPTPSEIRQAYQNFDRLDGHKLGTLAESFRSVMACLEHLKDTQRHIIIQQWHLQKTLDNSRDTREWILLGLAVAGGALLAAVSVHIELVGEIIRIFT